MASEVLSFDTDISVAWLLNGAAHFSAITDPAENRNIYALVAGTEDRIGMTEPVGPIGTLTSIDLTVKYKIVTNATGDWIGTLFALWNDVGSLGSSFEEVEVSFVPFTENYSIPIVGGSGDVDDLWLRLRTNGSSWAFGQAVIQIYQIIPTLVYAAPATEKAVVEIQLGVADSETILETETDEINLDVADSEIKLETETDEIELSVADDELILEVDAREET